MSSFELRPIGLVHSPLRERSSAPKQGRDGSPLATLVFDPVFASGLSDIVAGVEIWVLTWLDRADRSVLRTHPRGDPRNPLTGVFCTRSPDRPNPIGIHRVRVVSVLDDVRLQVENLEALDMTPILDVKPVLKGESDA